MKMFDSSTKLPRLAIWLFASIGMLTTTPSIVLRATAAAEKQGASLDDVKFEPGKEVKIDDSKTGGAGYWLVYLPSDFSPSRKWPVIYCYHGLGGKPTTWPFKELTDGKGFIIVGMEYIDPSIANGTTGPLAVRDLPNLRRIHDQLIKRVPIDEKLKFIGGMSQGGWAASEFGEASLGDWAGIIILGAGRDGDLRLGVGKTLVPAEKYAGKPIFIGVGEKDSNRPIAETGANTYRKFNADVTLEIFPNLGHAVDTKNAKLKQWLRDHGPLVSVKSSLAAAHAAEKSGKLGQAYALYQAVAQDANAADEAKGAGASAQAIADSADKAIADADAAIEAKKYAAAVKILLAAGHSYAGCDRAEKIQSRLTTLQKDPTIQAEIAQATTDAAADAAENAALAAEKSKEFKRAIAAYEAYVGSYPASHRIAEVRQHLAALKADKTIQSTIASKQVDTDCKAWLSVAQAYIASNSPERAKPYLQRVLDKYPGTEYAKTAAKMLAELN